MADHPVYVVDASVVARWYLHNPPYLAEALRVRDDHQRRRIRLAAPDNLRFEVVGAIRQAVSARFVQAARGREMVRDFLDWPIPLVQSIDLILPAYELSVRLGCSFYNAIYLQTAKAQNVPFIHADLRLRNALGNRFPLALWIEAYQPAN